MKRKPQAAAKKKLNLYKMRTWVWKSMNAITKKKQTRTINEAQNSTVERRIGFQWYFSIAYKDWATYILLHIRLKLSKMYVCKSLGHFYLEVKGAIAPVPPTFWEPRFWKSRPLPKVRTFFLLVNKLSRWKRLPNSLLPQGPTKH